MRISICDESPKELISYFIAYVESSIKNELPEFLTVFPFQEEIDEMVISEYLKYHKNYSTLL